MSEASCLVLIPVYNHATTLAAMVAGIRRHGLRCLLVDDGSTADCAAEIDRLAAEAANAVLCLRLPHNQGKGAAVLAGVARAAELGYRHVLQIDADGQHDTGEIPRFLEACREAPEAVICGVPVYDHSVPTGRLIGRYATHIWVWINTLSFAIRDSMCGFRLYPVAPVLQLAAEEPIGRRMDFDTEVLVRLYWRGLAIVNLPTPVSYPRDGISHFDLLGDNLRISRMHARLFFGMLRRLPRLLARRFA